MMNKLSIKVLILSAIVSPLISCSTDMTDLRSYAADVKNKSQGSVEPIPQFPPPDIYSYRSERNPFQALDVVDQASVPQGVSAPGDRPLEPLEYFPLDALSMVGTLDRGGEKWGLVKDSDGKIHRVKQSNHIGQNYGSITNIDSTSITITELMQDSSGLWAERVSQLHIGE